MFLEKLSSSDLNLLPVLQILMEEQSVTRAAERLNLSQPAISRSLARLRVLFKDPLFTRTPKGLAPTPRAIALSSTLQNSLQDIRGMIEPDVFMPETAVRNFRLATTDYGTKVFLPPVVRRLIREAPEVNLEILPWNEHLTSENDLQDIDVAVCTVTDTPMLIHGRGIGEDQFVCVVNQSHPMAKTGFSIESYIQSSHVLITMGGKQKGAVDYLLEEHGLSRRITLKVPHFIAAMALMADTSLVLTIPHGLAIACAPHYDLSILPFPFEQKKFTYSMIWHERYQKDAGHVWFRELLYQEFTQTISGLQSLDKIQI